jgi:hypothetical protein
MNVFGPSSSHVRRDLVGQADQALMERDEVLS